MRDERPSATATWVALCRGLATCLPEDAQLAFDPYGLAFGGTTARILGEIAPRVAVLRAIVRLRRGPFYRLALWLQMRTRVIDDVLLDFVARGGRQIVILGAGFDCRAARFAKKLAECVVYEVDHPATQAKKRRVLDEIAALHDNVRFLPWDFEARPMTTLPDALAALGHDAGARTLVIWEGVTMYLSNEAVDATLAAIAEVSASASLLVFNYLERRALAKPDEVHRFVSRVGEPYRFGWVPEELPAFLEERGFALVSDKSDDVLAKELLAPRYARDAGGKMRRIAVVRRA